MFDTVKNGAIVVAHPDDETMWCGGLMARYPDRWTVICCSIPRVDPVRAWKFFDACRSLGATARLIPIKESSPDSELSELSGLRYLDLSEYDTVVTHNAQGEYGHVHHKSVHRFVSKHAGEKMVTIGYGANDGTYGHYDWGQIAIRLNEHEWERKMAALRCYDHVSPSDGKPKWRALLDRYSPMFDLGVETYARA